VLTICEAVVLLRHKILRSLPTRHSGGVFVAICKLTEVAVWGVDSDSASSLFAMPSIVGVMARAFDRGSTMNVYNESANPDSADRKARASD